MTPTPARRIRLSRTKGWRMPAGAIKVDRTTRYGNPFIVGQPNGLGWGDRAAWVYLAVVHGVARWWVRRWAR